MLVSAAIKSIDGSVYTGIRHAECVNKINGCLDGIIQGFLTEDKKFLNREDAAKHAYWCGQVKELFESLTSEDLW